MIRTIKKSGVDRSKWTRFRDCYSGGGLTTAWTEIYVQADVDSAEAIFKYVTGEDPNAVACDCCGSNFSYCEVDDPPSASDLARDDVLVIYVEDTVKTQRRGAGAGGG